MKIVSFFESLKIGGWVEQIQATIWSGLFEQWHDVIYLVMQDHSPRNTYKGRIMSLDEEFIFGFWLQKIFSLFRLGHKVAQFCKNEQVDIIIGHGDFFYMAVAISKWLFWNRAKCIGVVHTTISIWPIFIRKALIFLLKQVDKVILISKQEYTTFLDTYWFQLNKIEMIYNSIDLDSIDEKCKEHLPKEFESLFSKKKFTFINIGRLTHQKNQKLLLKSFNELNVQYPKTQLIILWDWELRNELTNFTNTLSAKNNIHFLWNQSNIYPFLEHSDCFVLSSLFEGFWLVLVESMAVWKPIISTNCPSGPVEILSWVAWINYQVTKNAIICENNNSECLIFAMKEILLNERLRMLLSQQNLDRGKDFDTKCILRQWNELMKNV